MDNKKITNTSNLGMKFNQLNDISINKILKFLNFSDNLTSLSVINKKLFNLFKNHPNFAALKSTNKHVINNILREINLVRNLQDITALYSHMTELNYNFFFELINYLTWKKYKSLKLLNFKISKEGTYIDY